VISVKAAVAALHRQQAAAAAATGSQNSSGAPRTSVSVGSRTGPTPGARGDGGSAATSAIGSPRTRAIAGDLRCL
jgi:hypothetical protein